MRGAALLVAALAFVAVSCGSPSMSGGAADALQGHMDELRSAVEQENAEQAGAKLDELRAEARDRADDGEITAERLAEIESAAAQVERFLDELGTQPSPETEPTPEPTPEEDEEEEEPEDKEEEEEKEKEKKEKEKEKEDKEEKDQEEGEEGDGGPGKADEEEAGETNTEEGPTDEGAPQDETDTARATWAGGRLATPV